MAVEQQEDTSVGSGTGFSWETGMPTGADPAEANMLRPFFVGREERVRWMPVSEALDMERRRPGSVGTAESAGVP